MSSPGAQDTIAAIATPPGAGGIGIVRISGPCALPVLGAVFRRNSGSGAPFRPRFLHYGQALDAAGVPLDECLAVFMPGPQSFSGEDTAEIQCHGGRAVLEGVLEAVCRQGARLAAPGEFTRRALLNGRLDLSRAEAVGELIFAPTRQAARLARNKLAGGLGAPLEELRFRLDSLRVELCAALDFPAEEERHRQSFALPLEELRAALRALIRSGRNAALWRGGALAVLTGEVNAGKSSLFNALLGRTRALVSAEPGTTRDYLEESLELEGLPLRLADTAGLRPEGESPSALEEAGLQAGRELLLKADIILLLLEARPEYAAPGQALPQALLRLLPAQEREDAPVFLLLSKSDLCPDLSWPEEWGGLPCQAVSSRSGEGLERLRLRLRRTLLRGAGGVSCLEEAPPSLRQTLALEKALAELEDMGQAAPGEPVPEELLSLCLDRAAEFLAEVTGCSNSEELLDQVFAQFCIGK